MTAFSFQNGGQICWCFGLANFCFCFIFSNNHQRNFISHLRLCKYRDSHLDSVSVTIRRYSRRFRWLTVKYKTNTTTKQPQKETFIKGNKGANQLVREFKSINKNNYWTCLQIRAIWLSKFPNVQSSSNSKAMVKVKARVEGQIWPGSSVWTTLHTR